MHNAAGVRLRWVEYDRTSEDTEAVALLETALGTRLFQRATRSVVLTVAGAALLERCAPMLDGIDEAVDYVSSFAGEPRGHIKISAGIGFGVNVLSELLPVFLDRYPEIRLTLDLSTRLADMVTEGVDCVIRFGPLPDSTLISTQLGVIHRYLCASPAYLEKRGTPASISDLDDHDTIEMSAADGRTLAWEFRKDGETMRIVPRPRVHLDEVLTIHRLIRKGAGIGVVSAYICGPDHCRGAIDPTLPRLVHAVASRKSGLSEPPRARPGRSCLCRFHEGSGNTRSGLAD